MKVGDKLICIKDNPDYFIKGNTYIIQSIGIDKTTSENYLTIRNARDMDHNLIIFDKDSNSLRSYSHWFISKQALREKKLNKIC